MESSFPGGSRDIFTWLLNVPTWSWNGTCWACSLTSQLCTVYLNRLHSLKADGVMERLEERSRVRVVTSGLDALTHGQGLVPRCRVSALWVELPSAHKRLSIQVFMGKVPVLKTWATGSLTKMYNVCEFQGGGDSSHLHLSWELVAELIMKWTQDKWAGQGGGWKETHFNSSARRSHRNGT